MNDIEENLLTLRAHIKKCALANQREPNSITLLAASKGQSIAKIQQAIDAGQTIFGENYLQEALIKMTALPNVEWHFIGPIQSNKTKKIAEHFSWVHSVASNRIAKRLNDERLLHLPPLNVCIEVNVSGEKTKAGVSPEETPDLVAYCLTLSRLKIRGLMTIPAQKKSWAEQRGEFKKLRILYEELLNKGFLLDTLSMGMSEDWEAAIAEGATLIRIGTAIFGARN